MAITKSETKTEIVVAENGEITEKTTIKETSYEKQQEPDYIKIYTNMWCEFQQVPLIYRNLFLALATRMSYCNKADLDHSQLVYTGKPFSDAIMKECGWTSRDSYLRGLRTLCECNAIKKVARGVYQINPSYAGRGSWHYNPKTNAGGVKDLVAKFDFKKGTVDTNIIWADDGENTNLNELHRNGLNVSKNDETVLTTQTKKYINGD